MIRLQGDDASHWKWGGLQTNLNAHPLADAVDAKTRAKLNVGPLGKGGSAYTPNQSTYRASDFRETNGPSFRVVVDVGNWDNSRAVNLPGNQATPMIRITATSRRCGSTVGIFLCSTRVRPSKRRPKSGYISGPTRSECFRRDIAGIDCDASG